MRYNSALLLLFFFIIICPTFAHADDINCANWISETVTDNGSTAYSTSPTDGITESCTDHLPTGNERFKIKKTGATPPEAQYVVTTQYCWFRGADGKCQAFGNSQWGQTASTTFSTADIGKVQTAGAWSVCTQNVGHKQDYPHGGTNNGSAQVCAYVTTMIPTSTPTTCTAFWAGSSANKGLIGCVDAASWPGPPTYNITLLPQNSPVVDTTSPMHDGSPTQPGYLTMGSTFDQPMVRLVQLDNNNNVTKDLKLFYGFPGDTLPATKPNCAVFPMPGNNVTYCAKVPSDNPGQVCACAQNSCANGTYLGCVPRPTLRDSNLAVLPRYVESVQGDSSTTDTASFPAVSFAIVPTDAAGVKQVFDSKHNLVDVGADGNFYIFDPVAHQLTTTPANMPLTYTSLPLSPTDAQAIEEYYLGYDSANKQWHYLRGQHVVYGVTFRAIIPQFNNIKQMQIVYIVQPGQQPYCPIFTLTSAGVGQSLLQYIIPAGIRDNSYCCPTSVTDKSTCITPPDGACTNGSTQASDPTALAAFCPGIYEGPVDTPDQICLLADPIWPIVAPEDKVCAPIPTHCWTVPTPNVSSGYSTWTEDQQNNTQTQTGSCSSQYGFTQAITVSLTPSQNLENLKADQQAAADSELQQMQNQLTQLQTTYGALNLNIPTSLLTNGTYYSFTQTAKAPQRTCVPGTNAGAITNACAAMNQCKAITAGASPGGFATWADNTSVDIPTATTDGSSITVNTSVTGSCATGYQASSGGLPTRNCISVFTNPISTIVNTATGVVSTATGTITSTTTGTSSTTNTGNTAGSSNNANGGNAGNNTNPNANGGNAGNNSGSNTTTTSPTLLYQYWGPVSNPCVAIPKDSHGNPVSTGGAGTGSTDSTNGRAFGTAGTS